MRITYRGINIEYNKKNRAFIWAHGSASTINLIKAQINHHLTGKK